MSRGVTISPKPMATLTTIACRFNMAMCSRAVRRPVAQPACGRTAPCGGWLELERLGHSFGGKQFGGLMPKPVSGNQKEKRLFGLLRVRCNVLRPTECPSQADA